MREVISYAEPLTEEAGGADEKLKELIRGDGERESYLEYLAPLAYVVILAIGEVAVHLSKRAISTAKKLWARVLKKRSLTADGRKKVSELTTLFETTPE